MVTLILVAPITPVSVNMASAESRRRREAAAGGTTVDNVTMVNRNEFDPGILTTEVLAITDVAVAELGLRALNFSRVTKHSVLGRDFVSAIAEYEEMPTVELESASVHDFRAVITEIPSVGEMASWVNRTLVTQSDDGCPDEWLDATRSKIRTIRWGAATAQMRCGWGNSVITTDHGINLDSPASDLDSMISGLVDAQLIWNILSDLDRRSDDEVIRIADEDSHDPRPALARLADAQGMNADLSLCNLAYDAAHLKLQGNRHAACVGLLDAWNFRDAADRVTQRIAAISITADQQVERGAKRFRDKTEIVLLAIAISGLVQLVLAFVQTAYGGGTPLVPGDPDKFSTLRWIRTIPFLDLLIWIPTLLSITMFVYLIRSRRRDD